MEPGRIGLTAATEAARSAMQLESASDEPEHPAATPDADIEIVGHGIPEPMPAIGQIERSTGKVRAKGLRGMDCQSQGGQVARGRQVECPRWLSLRIPIDAR